MSKSNGEEASCWTDSRFSIKRGEVVSHCAPALEHLKSALVGLFVLPTPEQIDTGRFIAGEIVGWGSGLFVKYKENYFIATCGHVLEDPNSLVVYTGPSSAPLALGDICDPTSAQALVKKEDSDADIGFIRLVHPERLIERGREYHSLDTPPALVAETDGCILFMLGYPMSLSRIRITDRTPGGFYLPAGTSFKEQTIAVVKTPLFQISETNSHYFRALLEAHHPEEPEGSFQTGGCSGGPVFLLSDRRGLEGDPAGFNWVGIQSHETIYVPGGQGPRYLRFQHVASWSNLVDESDGNLILEASDESAQLNQ